MPLVTGAVVPTVTVTDCVVPLSCTEELDKLQAGAGVTAGLRLQPRLTDPLNPPTTVNARLNTAFCPA